MVEVWLPYGKTEVCVRVPTKDLLHMIEPNEKAAAKNPQTEIERALANPLGTSRLAETVKPSSKVALVLRNSDTSTNHMMVSAVLKELNSAGVADENVEVIVACDPLRSFSTKKQMPLFGEKLSSRVHITWHNCETSDCVPVGKTSRGTNVNLNSVFVDADVRIILGTVEPHLFAGYNGGPEIIVPGVSNIETVKANFSLALDKKAKRGVLKENPVHEDMVEAAELAKVDFSLNAVRNSSFEIVKAFAGDVNKAFEEAVRLADEVCRATVAARADIVFVSPGGFPFDGTLFDSVQCLDVAAEVVKRGKPIVLVAECMDGHGNIEFYEALSKFQEPKTLQRSLKKTFGIGGLVAHRFMKASQSSKIFLVSTLPDYYVSKCSSMKVARTANEAYRYASDVAGKNAKVSFISYGNLTIPSIKASD